jgi:hypothetical protein
MREAPRSPSRRGRTVLLVGAGCSLAVSLLHAVLPLIGPAAYRFIGGFNEARAVESGAAVRVALIAESVALLFAIWALYALSGAGALRRLPLLRPGLLVIGGIYTLRGLKLIPEIVASLQGRLGAPQHFLWFSAVSLAIGACYLVGTMRSWSGLRRPCLP